MDALKQLSRTIPKSRRVSCRFYCSKPVTLEDSQKAGQLFRIAQEAVNNALKHSRATRISILLSQSHDHLRLRISDNGRGFRQRGHGRDGMGLEVMRHRAQVIGGSLTVESRPGRGVTVACTLPLAPL